METLEWLLTLFFLLAVKAIKAYGGYMLLYFASIVGASAIAAKFSGVSPGAAAKKSALVAAVMLVLFLVASALIAISQPW